MQSTTVNRNWADQLTSTEADFYYSEIVTYLDGEVKHRVSEKYDKPIAFKHQKI